MRNSLVWVFGALCCTTIVFVLLIQTLTPGNGILNFTSTTAFPTTSKQASRRANVSERNLTGLRDVNRSTCARCSLLLLENTTYEIGGRLHAKILAKDYHNRPKYYGGDFFQVVLLRMAVKGDGIAATVTDYSNGTYAIEAPLLWEGTVKLKAVLVNPNESVIAYKLKTDEKTGLGIGFHSVVSDGVTDENEVNCGPFLNISKSGFCNFSNPFHGEPYYCFKPPNGCDKLTMSQRDADAEETKKWGDEWKEYFNPGVNWEAAILGSGIQFIVKKSVDAQSKITLPSERCGPQSPRSPPNRFRVTGYFLGEKWVSTLCKNRVFSSNEAKFCLRDTFIHIFGDSTLRQWFQFMSNWLKLKFWSRSAETDKSRPLAARSAADNLTMYFTPHGPPLFNLAPLHANRYISSNLDKIRAVSRNTTVVFTLGLHYLTFPESFFRTRVDIIKRSVLELQRRVPNVRVFVKNVNFHHTHSRDPKPQWAINYFNQILEREFGTLGNVTVINTWDMTLVQPPQGLHPDVGMLFHQINLFLSYLCS